jgi:hypothetical protein
MGGGHSMPKIYRNHYAQEQRRLVEANSHMRLDRRMRRYYWFIPREDAEKRGSKGRGESGDGQSVKRRLC